MQHTPDVKGVGVVPREVRGERILCVVLCSNMYNIYIYIYIYMYTYIY